MSGYNEGSTSDRGDEALVDQPETLAEGEFTEELQGRARRRSRRLPRPRLLTPPSKATSRRKSPTPTSRATSRMPSRRTDDGRNENGRELDHKAVGIGVPPGLPTSSDVGAAEPSAPLDREQSQRLPAAGTASWRSPRLRAAGDGEPGRPELLAESCLGGGTCPGAGAPWQVT